MEFTNKNNLKANLGATHVWKVLRNLFLIGEASVPPNIKEEKKKKKKKKNLSTNR